MFTYSSNIVPVGHIFRENYHYFTRDCHNHWNVTSEKFLRWRINDKGLTYIKVLTSCNSFIKGQLKDPECILSIFKLWVDWNLFFKKLYHLNPALAHLQYMNMAGYHKNCSRCFWSSHWLARWLVHSLTHSTVFVCILGNRFWNLLYWLSSHTYCFGSTLSQVKLTAADRPCPFGLFSCNDSIWADALQKKAAKIVSKEPCFINVNTVTGQNDQSPSGIHNYYSTQRMRDIKSREKGKRVETGAARWTALGKLRLH